MSRLSLDEPIPQFLRSRGSRNYRDYELAGMTVTYFEGEPVSPEQPAVTPETYPASWDLPVEHFANQTNLDFTQRRGSGGNWNERGPEVAARVALEHLSEELSASCFCPDCGGTIYETTWYAACDTCEWRSEF